MCQPILRIDRLCAQDPHFEPTLAVWVAWRRATPLQPQTARLGRAPYEKCIRCGRAGWPIFLAQASPLAHPRGGPTQESGSVRWWGVLASEVRGREAHRAEHVPQTLVPCLRLLANSPQAATDFPGGKNARKARGFSVFVIGVAQAAGYSHLSAGKAASSQA